MSATVTSDFKHEFEAESTRRLRKRFLWYCGVALGFGLLGQAVLIVMQIFASEDVKRDGLILSSISALSMIPYIWAFVYALRRRSIKRALLVRIVFWLLVMAGLANIGLAPVNKSFSEGFSEGVNQSIRAKLAENQAERDAAALADGATQEEVEALPDIFDDEPVSQVDPASAEDDQAATQAEPSIAEDDGEIVIATTGLENGGNVRVTVNDRNVGIGSLFMFNLFFAHFFAAMFIPWTPREAIAPLIPLVIANAIAMIIFKLTTSADSWTTIITAIALSPLVGVPGTLICWWRHSRYRQKFHYKMLRGRYGEIKQELSDAQRIHEALFPKAIGDGLVRMDYVYEPMRQIGGDYFFTRSTDREDGTHVFDLVLIDVTGHGLTAALTVNRLAGELQREFGENPETSPAQILTGLNNYVHHTLALHSVYATALALRIDTRKNRVEWASAGHPPAFLRGVDGRIDRLDSTALVLGACLGDDFVVDEESHTFGPGDTVVVYTDGATEARNAEGKMLSVRGLEAIIANDRPDEHGGWSATVMRHVEAHRHGPAEDDTLLVEVYRPVSI